MRQRCLNKNNPAYPNYGGRGIKICERWLESFENFRADVGEPPSQNHSLDRIDNEKGYEPGNVRWAEDFIQVRNRRVSVYLDLDGKHHIKELCDKYNADYFSAYDWIVRRKMDPRAAFEILRDSKKPSNEESLKNP